MNQVVVHLMRLFLASFDNFKVTDDKVAVYCEELKGISTEAIYAAGRALALSGSPYAPTLGILRKKALLFDGNRHLDVDGSTSWGNVLKKIKDFKYELTDLETKVLENVGEIYQLKKKTSSELAYDRTFYIRCFESERDKAVESVILPTEIKNFLSSRNEIKALPEKIEVKEDLKQAGFSEDEEREKQELIRQTKEKLKGFGDF